MKEREGQVHGGEGEEKDGREVDKWSKYVIVFENGRKNNREKGIEEGIEKGGGKVREKMEGKRSGWQMK